MLDDSFLNAEPITTSVNSNTNGETRETAQPPQQEKTALEAQLGADGEVYIETPRTETRLQESETSEQSSEQSSIVSEQTCEQLGSQTGDHATE